MFDERANSIEHLISFSRLSYSLFHRVCVCDSKLKYQTSFISVILVQHFWSGSKSEFALAELLIQSISHPKPKTLKHREHWPVMMTRIGRVLMKSEF